MIDRLRQTLGLNSEEGDTRERDMKGCEEEAWSGKHVMTHVEKEIEERVDVCGGTSYTPKQWAGRNKSTPVQSRLARDIPITSFSLVAGSRLTIRG